MAKLLLDIWQDTLAVIRNSVSAERFNLWFRNTELVGQEGADWRVGVPNAFVGQWLQEHYHDVVRGALGSISGEEARVKFVVSPGLYRDSRENELQQKKELVEALDTNLRKNAPAAPESGRPYFLDEFVVGTSNRLAYAAALHIVANRDGSLNPLVVHGACGLGKTHLLKGIVDKWNEQSAGRAAYISGESFTNQFLASLQHNSMDGFHRKFHDVDLLALDDLQFLADKPATQDEFLQIYNLLINLGKQIVLASDSHPREIAKLRGTLTTRLMSGMIVRLDPPEYETRLAILRKKLGGRCELLDEGILSFIAENVRGSVRELEGAATTLVATAALGGEKIDLASARRAVANLMGAHHRHVGIDEIASAVARDFNVRLEDIYSTRRHKSVALPRHVAMYLSRELTSLSWKEIGRHFGRHNHTGALFATKKIKAAIETDMLLADRVARLRAHLCG